MSEAVVEFTDDNFQSQVIESEQPVLVDFWAPWCGPCKRLTPIIEELATEFEGKVRVGKLNTQDNPQVPTNFQIGAIPTVLLFKNGEIVENGKFVGLTPKEMLSSAMQAIAS